MAHGQLGMKIEHFNADFRAYSLQDPDGAAFLVAQHEVFKSLGWGTR